MRPGWRRSGCTSDPAPAGAGGRFPRLCIMLCIGCAVVDPATALRMAPDDGLERRVRGQATRSVAPAAQDAAASGSCDGVVDPAEDDLEDEVGGSITDDRGCGGAWGMLAPRAAAQGAQAGAADGSGRAAFKPGLTSGRSLPGSDPIPPAAPLPAGAQRGYRGPHSTSTQCAGRGCRWHVPRRTGQDLA